MEPMLRNHETAAWDDEHIKALLHFPRFPIRLIQQEPWQSWIGQRGGLKAILAYLQNYPLTPNHRRMLDVVLSNPEAVADVYADRLNISRATYFYQLRELVPALAQALNHWELEASPQQPPTRPGLPAPLTTLVGAEATLQSLARLLQREDVRLLTLLGPGGIGKTRLGIELAHRWSGEAGFVDLSGLHEAPRLCAAIARALGLEHEREEDLKAWLRPREFFLVLDNFEQLLPARALVNALLSAAPRLKVLVTSRAALHLYGEHEFIVPPLPMSAIETVKDQQLWAQSPAVALFVQRAQAVNPGFVLNNENVEAVAELCLRTEGLPLAIEMAAFQVKYYSPQALLNQIGAARLDFFSHDPQRMPPHQQSLRAMLDWSFDLLTSDLQALFCQVAVFPGSFTAAEAQAHCGLADARRGLIALADHSLLEQQPGPDGEPCFKLYSLAREYALERVNVTTST